MVKPRLVWLNLLATGSGLLFVLYPRLPEGDYPGPGELDSGLPEEDYLVSGFSWDW